MKQFLSFKCDFHPFNYWKAIILCFIFLTALFKKDYICRYCLKCIKRVVIKKETHHSVAKKRLSFIIIIKGLKYRVCWSIHNSLIYSVEKHFLDLLIIRYSLALREKQNLEIKVILIIDIYKSECRFININLYFNFTSDDIFFCILRPRVAAVYIFFLNLTFT